MWLGAPYEGFYAQRPRKTAEASSNWQQLPIINGEGSHRRCSVKATGVWLGRQGYDEQFMDSWKTVQDDPYLSHFSKTFV